MNIQVIDYIIEGRNSGKDLYYLYSTKVNKFDVPFSLTKEIENHLFRILKNGNTEEIITILYILSKFKKEDDFKFIEIAKFLKKRDYEISLQAILAFSHSKSIEAENILVDYITNPKSDSFGQDAADILAKIISSKSSLINLIKKIDLIKGQTQSSVKNLIYRFSFNPEYDDLKEVTNFLISNKMKPIEKFAFKGWRKSTSDRIHDDLSSHIYKIHTKPPNKSNTSKNFYTKESDYYYSMYRIVLDHNPSTFIKVQYGLHPLTSHSWGLKHIEFGLRYTDDIEFKSLLEFKSNIKESIDNWKALIKNEIEILENSPLDEIHTKSIIFQKEDKLNVHSYSGYINWLAFNNRKEEILRIGKRAIQDRYLDLNESWIEYFNNLDRITVTNTEL